MAQSDNSDRPIDDVVLIIPGRAYSPNARASREYKRRILAISQQRFEVPLQRHGLRVRLDYFYTTGNAVDVDNLLKCVLDGLKGGVYRDDSQVDEVQARRYNITMSPLIHDARREWFQHLATRTDFLSIIVSEG